MKRRTFFRSLAALTGLTFVDPKKLLQKPVMVGAVDMAYSGADTDVYAMTYIMNVTHAVHKDAGPKSKVIVFKRVSIGGPTPSDDVFKHAKDEWGVWPQ